MCSPVTHYVFTCHSLWIQRYLDLLKEQRSQLEAELVKAIYAKERDLSMEFDRKLHTIQGAFELQLQVEWTVETLLSNARRSYVHFDSFCIFFSLFCLSVYACMCLCE